MLELPHHGPLAGTAAADRDYATTIARNFLYSAYMLLVWDELQQSTDAQLAAIAAKSLKETRYHLRHSRDWLVRLGDGTEESHERMQAALDHLMPYTQEFWTDANASNLHEAWDREVDEALAEATLRRPTVEGYMPRGKQGIHSEHLGFLLAEMQSVARQHPGATW
jgi:ring-1,2-phenylacetyl-CoA epoxidase subunit PaaC